MADYTLKVVTTTGSVTQSLTASAAFVQATWELNGIGSMDFDVHNYDSQYVKSYILGKEIQLFRDGTLIGWFVAVRAEATPALVRVSCRGLLWYFGRRFIGRADRTNILDNPSFETGTLDDWTETGTSTATADTAQRILGTKAAKLVSGTAQLDNYLEQTVTVTGTEIGTLYTLVAWYRVTDSGWLGEAINKRGMTISRVVGGDIQLSSVHEIDGATPRDSWQRGEVTIWVPPNATEDLEVRLYSPGGTIHWDAVSLTAMESLSNYGEDQTEIARQVVVHLQDAAYDKSDLNIATSTPATGVLRDRHYQHADHHNGLRTLQEFPALSDGFDFAIEVGTTGRTFHTYYPRKGGTPAALDFTTASLVGWTLRVDGEDACSSITILGDGDGPDREEGAALDLSVFGGLVLEDVVQAPPGAQIDSLDAIAAETLRLRKVAEVLTVTVPAAGFVAVTAPTTYDGTGVYDGTSTYDGTAVGTGVVVGDTGTPTLAQGFSTISGDWRVVRMTLEASDALTMELNPA